MGALGSKRKEYRIGGDGSSKATPEKFVEKVVCKDEEFQDGNMAEFDLGEDGKILLVKENGTYSALGPKCTHYGAPLKNGVLIGGKIRCPWHGACFDSKTGDIEDFPGLDSLPCYEVTVTDGNVKVKAPLTSLKSHKRVKPMTKYSHANPTTYIVIGGGAAGLMCCETLRQEGFSGKIILISKESNPPYDRPKLSKALDSKPSALHLRNEEFYKTSDISLMLETNVTSIDTKERWIACNNGKLKVKYDRLMIATGGEPFKYDAPGSDLKNIFYLRTPEDGNLIAKESTGKPIVIVGTSFIGMEVASYLIGKATSITVIGRSDVPFAAVFGKEIGARIKAIFEEKGVIFHNGKNIVKFIGNEGNLNAIELSSGEIISAEVCIIGIGVKPATEFLKDSGIAVNVKGQVIVNEMLETNIKGIFAGGDIIEFPLASYENVKANISHWQMALAHGRTAALNMLGKNTVFHSVPFFWSAMCGKNFRYAGYAPNFDEVIIKGDLEKLQFIAYYIKEAKVAAVCTCNKDPEAARFASCMSLGETILKSQIES
ncbi:Apoptosis-inducing factor 3 like protein [Argiope bruennichi]|uniref:Apoptosis-inducing factor 3 like protein n=1 Tax=Argiope bruennichi TaxID=94029 RepID=A0A8T0FU63_ARGBR|nr:Apoptosis-inducing factor 3 like protein [Argiope bruennichi]